ncbi:MAG: hypothetical protein JNN00_16575 [Chitinophagaceae bacterium]|nr:hypothetical protein [Chitinophagaceae bacterium]
MKKRKRILLILGVLLVAAAGIGGYIYKEYNRTHEDTADIKPDYSVAATDLITEFESNEAGSNKKYWDKVLEASGTVKDIAKDERGFYSVILGDTTSMSSVRCSMDSLHNKEASSLQKGNTVTMKGICTGFNADELLGSDVILVRCLVVSKK